MAVSSIFRTQSIASSERVAPVLSEIYDPVLRRRWFLSAAPAPKDKGERDTIWRRWPADNRLIKGFGTAADPNNIPLPM